MMNKKMAVILCLAGTLGACAEKTAPEVLATDSPAAATGANADAANAFRDSERTLQAARPGWDPKVPLENYTPIKQDEADSWVTYLAVAHGGTTLPDKELLELLSGKYFNEPDAFKKQELMPAELPPIKSVLAAYAGQRYYVLEFGKLFTGVSPSFALTSAFDVDGKHFKLSHDHSCLSSAYVNRQNVTFQFAEATPALCRLDIADLDMAKRVEQLRAARQTSLRGKIYFFVQEVSDGNKVKVIPTHVQYDVYDKPATHDEGKLVTSVMASATRS